MITLFTGINEHGVYIDLHDGTSMGGLVVFGDRSPFAIRCVICSVRRIHLDLSYPVSTRRAHL